MNGQNTCYINKLEKKTMIMEINTLAKALIKNEKKCLKMEVKHKKQFKEMKKISKFDQEDRLKLEQENF